MKSDLNLLLVLYVCTQYWLSLLCKTKKQPECRRVTWTTSTGHWRPVWSKFGHFMNWTPSSANKLSNLMSKTCAGSSIMLLFFCGTLYLCTVCVLHSSKKEVVDVLSCICVNLWSSIPYFFWSQVISVLKPITEESCRRILVFYILWAFQKRKQYIQDGWILDGHFPLSL